MMCEFSGVDERVPQAGSSAHLFSIGFSRLEMAGIFWPRIGHYQTTKGYKPGKNTMNTGKVKNWIWKIMIRTYDPPVLTYT